MRRDRRWHGLVCLSAVIALAAHVSSEAGRLTVERRGDRLRLSAPGRHFLEGAPLEQLRNGASVTFAFSVTVTSDRSNVAQVRVDESFSVSYDLWEERFSVTRSRQAARSASNLSAADIEAWCLDALSVPVSAVPPDKTFVIQLDCLVPDAATDRDDAPSGLTLAGLLDILSRRSRAAWPGWSARSGPLRLADLKDSTR
jgi:hypothetical protein